MAGLFDDIPQEQGGLFDDIPQGKAANWGPTTEILNGVMMGKLPQAEGWLSSHLPQGMMPSGAQIQADRDAYAQAHPIISSIANMAGGSLPYVAAGEIAAPYGLATRLGAMSGTGAATGAANALANGDQDVLKPAAEGAALGAGAELGGTAVSKLVGAALSRLGFGSGATRRGLTAATDKSYADLEATGAQFDPNAIRDMAAQSEQNLFRQWSPKSTPTSVDILQQLQDVPPTASNPSFGIRDFETARRQLGNIPEVERGLPGHSDYAASRMARSNMDDFLENPPVGAVLPNPNGVLDLSGMAREARANAKAGFDYDDVARLAGKGELNAAASHSGLNVGNSVRSRLKTLIDPLTGEAPGYTPEESQQINDIVRGTPTQNAVRYAGGLLGKGGGLGAMVGGAVLGHVLGSGELGAMAGLSAGRALGALDNSMSRGKVQALKDAILARSPYGQVVGPPAPPAAAGPAGRLAAAMAASGGNSYFLPSQAQNAP